MASSSATPAPIRVSDIYVTSGFPEFTFVPPGVYSRLVNALGQRTGGVIVEGPSGIGKTVAVTRAVSELGDALGRVTTLSSRDAKQVSEIKRVAAEKPEGTWIVEDFHHLPEADREALADAIKYLADQAEPSCKLVLIGINNAGQSLLVGSSDLLTRITVVEFERNPDESVEELISLGEPAEHPHPRSRADPDRGARQFPARAAHLPRRVRCRRAHCRAP